MPKPLPDVNLLNTLFILRDDGELVWKTRPIERFSSAMQAARWNKYYAGNVAGRIMANGYRSIKIFAASYQAHRIVWKMATGEEPGEIDHINRNKADNCLSNLRAVSRSTNMRNKPRYARNTSGHKHIHWLPRIQKWTVQLMIPGKGQRQMAYCSTIEEAVEVRDRLYQELDYFA